MPACGFNKTDRIALPVAIHDSHPATPRLNHYSFNKRNLLKARTLEEQKWVIYEIFYMKSFFVRDLRIHLHLLVMSTVSTLTNSNKNSCIVHTKRFFQIWFGIPCWHRFCSCIHCTEKNQVRYIKLQTIKSRRFLNFLKTLIQFYILFQLGMTVILHFCEKYRRHMGIKAYFQWVVFS